MGMVVRSNIMAMNANRSLGMNNSQVSKNLEKLSSGFKINRAGDDASGLAISEKMKAQIKGLETASANAQDGISLVQTAEGALTEVHSMLNRMVELATKSANGTIQDPVDREAIQSEVDALLSEIDRIGDSTNFNGINLLDGSLGGSSAAGGLTGGKIASFKGAETAATSGADASAAFVAATTGKYTLKIGTALTGSETFTVGGLAIEADGNLDATTNTTKEAQASKIADLINSDATLKANWVATVSGDTITLTNKVEGATTTIGSLTGANATKATLAGAAGTAASGGINFGASDTVTVDGTEIKVDWSALSDTDKAILQKNFSDGDNSTADEAKKAAELIQKTINQSIAAHNARTGTKLSNIKVESAYNGSGNASTFKFTSGQKDGNSEIKFTGGTHTVLGKLVGTTEVKTADPVSSLSFSPADISNGKFNMKIGDQNVEVALGALTSTSTAADVVNALNAAITTALGKHDHAQGLTGSDAISGKISAKLNADGAIEFSNTSGQKIGFSDKADGEIAKTLGISAEGKSATQGGLTLQVGDTGDDFNMVTVKVDDMRSGGLGLTGLDVSNADSARASIDTIKNAINKVSTNRANLGALQNRLEYTINNLDVSAENMSAANSRIRDTDMAKQMMEYTKTNVLTQAAQAMLAQANQQPQSILQLLQ